MRTDGTTKHDQPTLLLTAFTPWSAINVIDYYLISRERVDIPALYEPDGRDGRWNVTALVSYVVGIGVQIPFLQVLVTSALHYTWVRRTADPPSETVHPPP